MDIVIASTSVTRVDGADYQVSHSHVFRPVIARVWGVENEKSCRTDFKSRELWSRQFSRLSKCPWLVVTRKEGSVGCASLNFCFWGEKV